MAPAGGEKKKGGCGKIILILVIVFIVLGLIGGVGAILALFVCSGGGGGGTLTANTPETFTLSSGASMMMCEGQERPCVDYSFTPDAAGTFAITLVAPSGGDPHLCLLDGGGAEIAANDDFGGLNSTVTQALEASEYTLRTCSHSDLFEDLELILTAAAAPAGVGVPPTGMPPTGMPPTGMPPTGTPPTGTPPTGTPPAAGGGATGCDGLAACCAANPPVPNAQVTCGQVETWRGLPGGAGETACSTALQGLRNAAQAMSQTMPAQCN